MERAIITKDRLRAYRMQKRELEQLRGLLDEIETSVYYPGAAQVSDMPRAPARPVGGSAQERAALRTMEIRDKYADKIAELQTECLIIERAVEAVPESTERLILRMRYLQGLSWETIADDIGLTVRQITRRHGRALQMIKEVDLWQP